MDAAAEAPDEKRLVDGEVERSLVHLKKLSDEAVGTAPKAPGAHADQMANEFAVDTWSEGHYEFVELGSRFLDGLIEQSIRILGNR